MKLLRMAAAWVAAVLVLLWRATCRYRVVNDPRPALRAAGKPYAYALLHAHQVAAVFVNDERRMAAMVSRSNDGDLLVPSLRVRRVRPVRGSSRTKDRDKGGQAALQELTQLVVQKIPVLLAVDGPRGPRGTVHRGVLTLATEAQATILPTVVVCSRRFVLRRTWDRFQIPKPFSTITLAFGDPMEPPTATAEILASALRALEQRHDAAEVVLADVHTREREARAALKTPSALGT